MALAPLLISCSDVRLRNYRQPTPPVFSRLAEAPTVDDTAASTNTNASDSSGQPVGLGTKPDELIVSTTDQRASIQSEDDVIRQTLSIRGQKITTWREGPVGQEDRMLLLDSGAAIQVGNYGFNAGRAVIRLRRPILNQPRFVAAYLEDVHPIAGAGNTNFDSDQLLLTFISDGEVTLLTDLLDDLPSGDKPDDSALTQAAAARFADFDKRQPQRLVASNPRNPRDGSSTGASNTSVKASDGNIDDNTNAAIDDDPSADKRPPGQPGVIYANATNVEFVPNIQGEHAVVLKDGVRLIFQQPGGLRSLTLQSDHAVVFLDERVTQTGLNLEFDATAVHGIYLEDNVIATDGQYTVRAPRVFYDPSTSRAALLNAVLYTWDVDREIPIYVRASKLMQLSRDTWEGRETRVTTSEFATPHVAIGAERITVRRETNADGQSKFKYIADNATVRLSDTPVFWWPRMAGDMAETPLRQLSIGFDGDAGPEVRTSWDLFALAGAEAPEGVSLEANVDWRGEHGPGIGLELDYDRPRMFGEFEAYMTALDEGDDQIGSRKRIEHDGDQRGFINWQHRQYLDNNWELSLEAGWVSDETFLESYYRDQSDERKPYELSAYLKKQEQDWAFDFLAKYDANDFTAQTDVLQAPGYTVDKLPELGLYKLGASLLEDRVTWFGSLLLSRMRIRAGEDSPRSRGFTRGQAERLFGISRVTRFEDAIRQAGITQDERLRVDTRQEIQAPVKIGAIDFVPYVAGRVTAYDRDFEDYRGEDQNYRLWGIVGARMHTQLVKTDDAAESQLFDVHRLRHIIEPAVDVVIAGADIESEDLPVYDRDVEALAEGFGARAGVRNTWQTQRGGEGRWRNVDWFTIAADVIYRADDADIDAPLAHYYSYRPEYSVGGTHAQVDAAWQATDSLAVASDATINLEDSYVPQWRVGLAIDHSPHFQSHLAYTELADLDTRLLSYGFDYQLTRKYTLGFNQAWDIDRGGSRSTEASLIRRLPRWRFMVVARYDDIDDNFTVGAVLVPEGLSGGRTADPWRGKALD